MDEPFDAFLDLDENAKVRDRADLAMYAGVDRIALGNRIPRIAAELLHTQTDAFVLRIDPQHHRFDIVTLLQRLRRMAYFLGPREIRNMHQSIDSGFDLDERAEIGD